MKKNILLPIIAASTGLSVLPVISLTSCNKNSSQTLTAKDLAKQCISLLAMTSATSQTNISVTDALKQVDVIIENLENDQAITVTDVKSDRTEFAIRQDVAFKSKDSKFQYSFTLYYNDVTTKYKEKHKEIEVKSCMEGLCKLNNGDERAFQAVLEHEASLKEVESETKFYLYHKGSITSYDEFVYEKETEKSEVEHKYKYKTVVSGIEVKEYEIKIEIENSKFVVKLEVEEGEKEEEHKLIRKTVGQDVFFYEYKKGESEPFKTYKRVVDSTTGDVSYIVVE